MRLTAVLIAAALSFPGAMAWAQSDGGGRDDGGAVDASEGLVAQGDAAIAGDAGDPLDEPPSAEEERAAEAAVPDEEREAAEVETGRPEGGAVPEVPRVAVEIAALTDRACLRALARTTVPFIRVRQAVPGVALPVMVTGPFRGVTLEGRGTPAERELMDCRLAVALARYARWLRTRGIRAIRHISLHRPASPAELARRPVQTRHPAGLAVDAAAFVTDEGQVLDVLHDFRGRRGAPVCGPGARVRDEPRARALRTLPCEAARRGYFNVVLTPNFNRAHRNHFHLEIARDVSWIFVR